METNHNNLVRDKYSKALLFTNISEIKNYNAKKSDRKKINNLENEVLSLKEELKELRTLLIKKIEIDK